MIDRLSSENPTSLVWDSVQEQITGIQTRKDNRMDEEEEIWKVELENRRLAAEHHREMLEWEHQQWLKNKC